LLENGKPPSGKVKAARLFRSEGKGHVMTEMKEQPPCPLLLWLRTPPEGKGDYMC